MENFNDGGMYPGPMMDDNGNLIDEDGNILHELPPELEKKINNPNKVTYFSLKVKEDDKFLTYMEDGKILIFLDADLAQDYAIVDLGLQESEFQVLLYTKEVIIQKKLEE
jgi:hypothetical protein